MARAAQPHPPSWVPQGRAGGAGAAARAAQRRAVERDGDGPQGLGRPAAAPLCAHPHVPTSSLVGPRQYARLAPNHSPFRPQENN